MDEVMKLIWKWCEFSRHRTIIWIKFRSKYYQYIFFHELRIRITVHNKLDIPRIINI